MRLDAPSFLVRLARRSPRAAFGWLVAAFVALLSFGAQTVVAQFGAGEPPREYIDTTLTRGRPADEIESPLSRQVLYLQSQGYKCLWSQDWAPGQRLELVSDLGRQLHVVECDGNCRGVTYTVVSNYGAIRHLGSAQGYPMIDVNRRVWTRLRVFFDFVLPNKRGPLPAIRVHTFSNSFGASGVGCNFRRAL